MALYINPTDVIWHYKGYDNGIVSYVTPYWNDLPEFSTAACEYAYLNNIEEISIKNGEYLFDLKNNLMFIFDEEMLFQPIPIKRSG